MIACECGRASPRSSGRRREPEIERADLIKNFLARVGCLTVIAAVALGAWHYRGEISAALGRVEIAAPSGEPSESLARAAEEKLMSLAGSDEAEVSLTEVELQSLLSYRVTPHLPSGIEDPLVRVQDSVVVLSALLRPDQLDQYAPPDLLRQFLADTARAAAILLPGIRRPGTGQVTVSGLQAGALIVPSVMIPFILQSVQIPGLDASGSDILVPLPGRVSAIEVAGGAVVVRLEAQED